MSFWSCNIDNRGRTARWVAAGLFVIAGIRLVWVGLTIAGVLVLLAGAFTAFEAARGWCVVRALGFKTKL